MKGSFLAVVVALVVAGSASAQFSTYVPQQSTCANGQCGRVQASVQAVRSVVAEGIHRVGDVVAPPTVVQGVWAVPAQPWYPQLPAVAPQQMPPVEMVQPRTPRFPRLARFFSGN